MTLNGLPDGNGTLTYKNGDEYVGSFQNGNIEGYGKLTFASDDDKHKKYQCDTSSEG